MSEGKAFSVEMSKGKASREEITNSLMIGGFYLLRGLSFKDCRFWVVADDQSKH